MGLYDMHGNVWEWTYDRSGLYSSSSQIDPTGSSSGSHPVIRGGSWWSNAGFLRSAGRGNSGSSNRIVSTGFRVVLVAGPQGGNNGGMTSLSIPSNLATTASSGTITLSWNAVDGASQYCTQIQTGNIVDQSYPNSNCVTSALTSKTYYQLQNGLTYYVSVKALSNSTQSNYSSAVAGYPSTNLLTPFIYYIDGDQSDFIFTGHDLPTTGVREPGFETGYYLYLYKGYSYEFHSVTTGVSFAVPSVSGVSGSNPASGPYESLRWDVPTTYFGNLDFYDPGNFSRNGTFIVTDAPFTDFQYSSGYSASNASPIANNNMASTNINQSITIDVLANDSDADNDLLTITDLSTVSNGSASIVSGSSAILVTPSYDSTLPVTFTYTISDGNGGYDSASVVVTVNSSSVPISPSGTTWTDPNYSIEMVRISSGTFMMGSPNYNPNSSIAGYTDESPQHQVTISKDFYIGKYEVTQGQWQAVMNTTPWESINKGVGSTYPAYYVDLDDITGEGGFLDKINQLAGCDISNLTSDPMRYHSDNVPVGCYRLPTEAEWEYSARAGTTTPYSYGHDENHTNLGDHAWYSDVSNNRSEFVGQKLPNPWGLFDMHGNVKEWTSNCIYSYTSSSVIDPGGPISNNCQRQARGGAWNGDGDSLTVTLRPTLNHTVSFDIGFRLIFVTGSQDGNNSTNASPIASDDFAFTNLNQSITIDVLGNDYDADNNLLTIVDLSHVSNGSASIVSGSGAILVTPSYDSTLPVTFTYTISDGNGGYDSAFVSVSIFNNSTGGSGISSTWTDPNYSIDMILISSGTFTMGSPDTETGRYTDGREGPQHQVTISKDFYLGKYEVTQGQWENVIGGVNPWPGSSPSSEHGQSSSHPAYWISWEDINKVDGFLDKLNETSGCDTSVLPTDTGTRYHPTNVPSGCYRLPTESEWEYSARAGTTTRFSFGDDEDYSLLGNYAWYNANSDGKSHPVGGKLVNPWGLYDMYGNVVEFNYDRYDFYTSSSKIDPSGPGPSSGSSRVARGGSWRAGDLGLRSAGRYGYSPTNRNYDGFGFRLVKVPKGNEGQSVATLPVPTNVMTYAGDRGVTLSWDGRAGCLSLLQSNSN